MAGMLLSNDSRRPCNRMQRAVLAKPLFPFASTRNALSTSVTPACQCGRGGIRESQQGWTGCTGREGVHSSLVIPAHPTRSFQPPTRHSSAGWNPERPTGHTAGGAAEERHQRSTPTGATPANPSFQPLPVIRRLESRAADRPVGGAWGQQGEEPPVPPTTPAPNPSFQPLPVIPAKAGIQSGRQATWGAWRRHPISS